MKSLLSIKLSIFSKYQQRHKLSDCLIFVIPRLICIIFDKHKSLNLIIFQRIIGIFSGNTIFHSYKLFTPILHLSSWQPTI